MNIEKMREEFEAAFKESGYVAGARGYALDAMLERGSDGEYRSVRIHGAWWAWQASRAAIEIKLPDPFWPGYIEEDEPGLCISTDLFTMEQFSEAIEAAGLEVKS